MDHVGGTCSAQAILKTESRAVRDGRLAGTSRMSPASVHASPAALAVGDRSARERAVCSVAGDGGTLRREFWEELDRRAQRCAKRFAVPGKEWRVEAATSAACRRRECLPV